MDGDGEWPTICGTGTEDYFCGAWNFEHPHGEYGVFCPPYSGLAQVIRPDGLYRSQQRFRYVPLAYYGSDSIPGRFEGNDPGTWLEIESGRTTPVSAFAG